MRTAIVVFTHQLCPKEYFEDTKHILWHFFLKYFNLWHHYINRLFVLDFDCNLTFPKWAAPYQSKIKIIDNPYSNHYTSLDNFVKFVPENDQVLMLDSDMIIYNKETLQEGFGYLANYDAAGIFSTDGCRMRIKNTIFDKNDKRNSRGKLANWLTFVRGNWLRNTSFEYIPWGSYKTEPFTEKILFDGGVIKEMPEDYWQIVCDRKGNISEQYYEAEDGDLKEKNKAVRNIGYYHIWHSSHIWKILNNSFENHVFPYTEQLRLGAWGYCMTEIVEPEKLKLFDGALKAHPHFLKYIEKFKEYHKYIYDQIV